MKNNMSDTPVIRVGVVDDHVLFTKGVVTSLSELGGISVTLSAHNGEDLLSQLENMTELPDILLMDVYMPGIGGVEATKRVTALYPSIKIIAISTMDDDLILAQMAVAGALAYLRKDVNDVKLKKTIYEIHAKGKYEADMFHLYGQGFRMFTEDIKKVTFTERETCYLQLYCKGYNYTQVAAEMNLSVRTMEYYKKTVSKKLRTDNLVLIILMALRMNILQLHQPKVWKNKI
jgi:DNA-binding NarL/FixJ family response regulator